MTASRITALVLVALAGFAAWELATGERVAPARATLEVARLLGDGEGGFAKADGPRAFAFPADHGAHPRFRHEWWYVTGNVATPAGRAFGYQLTFFRAALPPGEIVAARASDWASAQLYLAHFAVTDVDAGRLHAAERLARDGLDLAGARADPLRVWLEDWSLAAEGAEPFPARLRAREGDVALELVIRPEKPRVLHGERGFSKKSADGSGASYYYSYTRLATAGTITVGGRSHAVQGLSWLDREWSSGTLARTQIGWDWFSLQLDDGRELMWFELRERGDREPFRSGTLIAEDGSTRPLGPGDATLAVRGLWTSPASGVRYPARWRLAVPSADLELDIEPLVADQELPLSIRYWEGAVRARDPRADRPTTARGYVELTGYVRE